MHFSPDPRFNGFFLLTGVTFASFASGFGVCLFNLDTVDSCAAVSDQWFNTFLQVGNHIITWAFAMFHAIMSKQ